MATLSSIEWTETPWNPVTGCTKISPGCKYCYAETMARRLRGMGQHHYRNGFTPTLQDDLVEAPLRWRKQRVVFVNSMSDLFHGDVPDEFVMRVFATMEKASHHTFQVLTKRSERLRQLAPQLPWPDNVWMGVSVEDRRRTERVADLITVPARVRFLSIEPLLESIPHLPLDDIQRVIVGGESGRRPRPIRREWVREIRNQCMEHGVPFFFKQWGGTNKKKSGRKLDNRTWDQMPYPPTGQ
ncbi:MAG: phage Gp37/Gp68 family protein [Proteobacteria bacterium]|nr:phage Gp37/Gp68 family protein [Pseudomonadota bacterium]